MKQILEQLSEAWNMASTLYDKTQDLDEKAAIKKRMDQIASLMETTMSRTFAKNEIFYRQAIVTFKKNQKDIEQCKAGLNRSTQAIRFLTDIVARVDSLLQTICG